MKTRSQFVCQQCGYKSPSFLGKCPECGAWNSLVETVERETKGSSWTKANRRERTGESAPIKLSEIKTKKVERISTGIKEMDQVLGGGIVPGSVILLSGDPGIGKSTLTLQVIAKIGGLYVTGEESGEQVKLRAERLGVLANNISILAETNIESILDAISNEKGVNFLIVDSIQTLWSEELTGTAGSVGQVRECTLKLLEFAKSRHIPIILIGHVTKEGTIAGPKVLEHIVDTVLYLEGERYQSLRLLRTTKNRFGPVDEVGVFSMEDRGIKEVTNPSELFLGERTKAPGSVVVATLEGSRPLLVEVQALTVSTHMPVPRRVGNGVNTNR
ncbi:DNA repair protein RadA, partial [Candidatus Gottesmanbacteria bacterium]|nr:DNA repair protein RadA [Candidatus Gottesmanbacteria bacterium]